MTYRPLKHNRAQLEVWLDQHLEVRNWGKNEVNCVCPFHQSGDTKRPDLWVNVEKGVYHCLSSSCGVRGHVSDLVRRLTGASWEDARRAVGRPGVEALGKLLDALRPQPEAQLSLSWDLIEAHRSTHYWGGVRHFSLETQEHFWLGFDFERNHGLIPYLDQFREPLGFIRRQLDAHPRYLYPTNFPNERAVFHLYAADPSKPLIVCEGSTDCMRIWEAGFQNVVALLGSEVPLPKAQLLRHFKIVSFFDADPAGVQATLALRDRVGRIINRVNYPDELQGQDPDKLTPAQIRACLASTVPVIY